MDTGSGSGSPQHALWTPTSDSLGLLLFLCVACMFVLPCHQVKEILWQAVEILGKKLDQLDSDVRMACAPTDAY